MDKEVCYNCGKEHEALVTKNIVCPCGICGRTERRPFCPDCLHVVVTCADCNRLAHNDDICEGKCPHCRKKSKESVNAWR